MKIALVIASLGRGGAERMMSLLASHWAERGDDVVLITLEQADCDAYPLHPAIERVALGLVADSGGVARAVRNNAQRLLALRRVLQRCRGAIVLSFEDRTNVLTLIATLGLSRRVVVSERTDPTMHRIGRVWSVLRCITYPLADALVVQTARLLPWAAAVMLGRKRVHVIPNVLRSPTRVGPAREAVQRSVPVVASVGRLYREKGYDVLIRAFAAVAAEFPEWTLAIVGEGPQRGELVDLAHALGVAERLALRGWMPRPEDALADAAIFVKSSRYEGFPNALLEAMGSGLPVISTTCGGSEELVEAGVTGLLVAPDDVAATAAALRALMSDSVLRAAMGQSALIAARRYLPARIMPLWDEVLNDTCLPQSAPGSCS